ncbi:hypothetical protein TWF594_009587 [Orbilia oligospora]|nr:hypothetical protein TWF594_009587 [Orbilia oligospora]
MSVSERIVKRARYRSSPFLKSGLQYSVCHYQSQLNDSLCFETPFGYFKFAIFVACGFDIFFDRAFPIGCLNLLESSDSESVSNTKRSLWLVPDIHERIHNVTKAYYSPSPASRDSQELTAIDGSGYKCEIGL